MLSREALWAYGQRLWAFGIGLIEKYWAPDQLFLLVAATVVGFGAGAAIIAFHIFMEWVHDVSVLIQNHISDPVLHIVAITALGGLIVGLIMRYLAPEAAGSGIPHALRSLALEQGRMPLRVVIWRPIATATTLGFGGSAGREGPTAHFGAALGSVLGRWMKMSDERVRTLVACGAAAGISASFNAPIAGVFFALEVLLQDLSGTYFGMVVISSVLAGAISRTVLPGSHLFAIPNYGMTTPLELALYAILGVLEGPIAVLFIYTLHGFGQALARLRLSTVFRVITGMVLTGFVALWAPQVQGSGFDTISQALNARLPLSELLRLIPAKFFATTFTVGAGTSGGVFAPLLYMGSMIGAAYGQIVHALFPTHTELPGAFALVGMAALFSAASHAPITSVLIIFELTGDYYLMLPLMLTTVLSTFVSQWLNQDSVYTYSLSRMGIRIGEQGTAVDLLQSLRVLDAMSTEYVTVTARTTLRELSRLFAAQHQAAFPVVDEKGNALGAVFIEQATGAIEDGLDENRTTVADLVQRSPILAYPNEPLWVARRRLRAHDMPLMPVVESPSSRRLVGVLRMTDIEQMYAQVKLRLAQLRQRIAEIEAHHPEGVVRRRITLPADSPWAGHPIQEIPWPGEAVVEHIRRAGLILVPRGTDTLQSGDVLVLAMPRTQAEAVEAFLLHPERAGPAEEGGRER
jgi:CIC family chloride channel protein